MNKILFFLLAGIIICSCENAEKPGNEIQAETEGITKEEALSLLHNWTEVYLSGNAASLEEVLDESWAYSGSPDGRLTTKPETIEEFSKADYRFADITYDELDVRLYDDIAIIRGREMMVIVGNSGKDTTKLRLRFTDVYQKKQGKVKAISTHSSPINSN